MSRNPFDGQLSQSPYDRPVPLVQSQSHQTDTTTAVLYDAATKSASPAGVAFADDLKRCIRSTVDAARKETARTIADLLVPMEKRLRDLEAALVVEREKSAKAVETVLTGFLGDAPTMDELERRAQAHREKMKGIK